MSGWNDYFVTTPVLCAPSYILKGITYALCERKEKIDSSFHSSCEMDGGVNRPIMYTSQYYDIIMYGQIGANNEHLIKIQRQYNFYNRVDAELYLYALNGAGCFVKSNGSSFESFDDLAEYAYSGLTYDEKELTQSSLFINGMDESSDSDLAMYPMFPSKWAIQRRNMINALVYMKSGNTVIDVSSDFIFKKI